MSTSVHEVGVLRVRFRCTRDYRSEIGGRLITLLQERLEAVVRVDPLGPEKDWPLAIEVRIGTVDQAEDAMEAARQWVSEMLHEDESLERVVAVFVPSGAIFAWVWDDSRVLGERDLKPEDCETR